MVHFLHGFSSTRCKSTKFQGEKKKAALFSPHIGLKSSAAFYNK
ncbi:hypothetical protein M076_0057 [Bacteroides fragilis str. 2-F-2 |uniref:Uncharacterized protein n=1 Tax=Bacteroides fragilis str. 2-F-2 \|nr:hypothetical protein M076_0057 [Bacteroides fragilis str. 2-F-2 \